MTRPHTASFYWMKNGIPNSPFRTGCPGSWVGQCRQKAQLRSSTYGNCCNPKGEPGVQPWLPSVTGRREACVSPTRCGQCVPTAWPLLFPAIAQTKRALELRNTPSPEWACSGTCSSQYPPSRGDVEARNRPVGRLARPGPFRIVSFQLSHSRCSGVTSPPTPHVAEEPDSVLVMEAEMARQDCSQERQPL